jgi:hypothetical protein
MLQEKGLTDTITQWHAAKTGLTFNNNTMGCCKKWTALHHKNKEILQKTGLTFNYKTMACCKKKTDFQL